MIVSFKELKSYYKNILIKYYELSFLKKENFLINKNKLSINSLLENVYFNNDIILKNDIDHEIDLDYKIDLDNKIDLDPKIDLDNKIDNKKHIDKKKKNKNKKINIEENNKENIKIDIEENNISNILDNNINYSVLKILSFYYNLNDIIVEKNSNNKYTIKNKINNNFEYFYYNNTQITEIYIYYKILYDNNKKNNDFSVLIQIGNYSTFLKMISYIKLFINLNACIYYTIVEEECKNNNIDKIKEITPNCTILKTRNTGMDIGLFIINLIYFRDKNINPKYILKLHTKTDDIFRNNVLNNLCKNKETIKKNLSLFQNNNTIGMLTGTFVYSYNKNKSFYNNHMNYLHYLSKYIFNKELKLNNLEFAVGTFFYAKFDLFSILDVVNLKFLYNKLNNLKTLDINWYKIFYKLHKLSDDEIIIHYRNYPTNYGNNLIMQHKSKSLGMRDFMIEHSLERFLGYICKYNNLNIIEV